MTHLPASASFIPLNYLYCKFCSFCPCGLAPRLSTHADSTPVCTASPYHKVSLEKYVPGQEISLLICNQRFITALTKSCRCSVYRTNRALSSTVMLKFPTTPLFNCCLSNRGGSNKTSNLLGTWATVSFSTRTVLYAIRCSLPKMEKVSF